MPEGFTLENKTDYGAFKEILKKRLNEKRYYHSLCVADEAKRLAEKYGGGGHACASGATLKRLILRGFCTI